jgi:hypothetical protein
MRGLLRYLELLWDLILEKDYEGIIHASVGQVANNIIFD